MWWTPNASGLSASHAIGLKKLDGFAAFKIDVRNFSSTKMKVQSKNNYTHIDCFKRYLIVQEMSQLHSFTVTTNSPNFIALEFCKATWPDVRGQWRGKHSAPRFPTARCGANGVRFYVFGGASDHWVREQIVRWTQQLRLLQDLPHHPGMVFTTVAESAARNDQRTVGVFQLKCEILDKWWYSNTPSCMVHLPTCGCL